MNSALEGTILGQLAVHYPEPVEATEMFVAIISSYSTMDEFVDTLKYLAAEGLVKITTQPELRWSVSLTEEGLEFILSLMDEAIQVVRAAGNVAEA